MLMLSPEVTKGIAEVICMQVLIPTSQFLRNLVAARLAADVADVPTLIIARTDAHSAALLTSDIDEVDRKFCTGERTPEGYYRVTPGVKVCLQVHHVAKPCMVLYVKY